MGPGEHPFRQVQDMVQRLPSRRIAASFSLQCLLGKTVQGVVAAPEALGSPAMAPVWFLPPVIPSGDRV